MNKIDCIEDYFASIRAYYLFQMGKFFDEPEYKNFILDKKYLNGAKVAFLSNLMLGIKEDLVDNKGNMEYQSKVFIEALENSVGMIATKVENGYKLSNYVFPDAATLVAIVRNKLAHGKYTIDFSHNRVILTHKGVDIIININKLITFVLMSFKSTLKNKRDTKYERNIIYYSRFNSKRTECVRDLTEVRKIIKNYNYVSFTIESLDNQIITEDCIYYLEGFIKYFGKNLVDPTKGDFYRDFVKYLESKNCKLKMEYKSLRDKREIDKIINFASQEILGNDNLDYLAQVKLIGLEVQKSINGEYKNFNAITGNISNITLLDAINVVGSVEDSKLDTHINSVYPYGIRQGYDEFGMTLLAMFNSLFIYPFDDVYDTSGEYSVNRSDVLDFSILDLSMINPTIITIDDSPLVNAKARVDSLSNKINEVTNKISQQVANLNRVSGKPDVVVKINKGLSDLSNSLTMLKTSYNVANGEYNTIKNDFTVNSMYFQNKAIIEGIRNSIAHGHYEFISKGNIWDTEVIFNDIYEGKVTFQVKMTFDELTKLIDNNYMNVLNYVKNKNVSKKK